MKLFSKKKSNFSEKNVYIYNVFLFFSFPAFLFISVMNHSYKIILIIKIISKYRFYDNKFTVDDKN